MKRVSPALIDPKDEELQSNNYIAIESRVARIKARVAELTGNMEAAR